MKVKMLETVQGAGISGTLLKSGTAVNILEPGGEYEVDDALGVWILENRKGDEVDAEPVHYGGQKKAELRHDEEKYARMAAESEKEEQPGEDEPIMTTENQATRKPKRGKK